MRRNFKKVIAIAMTAIMMLGMSTSVFAEEGESYCISKTSYKEVTDIDTLTLLALDHDAQRLSYKIVEDNNPKILTVEQTLEEREFSNGTVEKDVAISQIIPKQTILDARDATTPVSEYLSDTVTGHSISSTFYFTVKLNQTDLGAYQTYRFDKLVTNIVKTEYTGITYTSGTQMYIVESGVDKWQNIYYNNSATPGTRQTFTLNTSHSAFYSGNDSMWAASMDGVFGQVSLDFSNGENVLFQFNAWQ